MKNVKEMFNMCSTEQSCRHIGITCYKIGTLEACAQKCSHLPLHLCPQSYHRPPRVWELFSTLQFAFLSQLQFDF